MGIKDKAKKFHQELNNSMRTSLVAGFGFLMALVWRDLITEYINKLAEATPIKGALIGAIIVSVVCVGGILIVTRLFPAKD